MKPPSRYIDKVNARIVDPITSRDSLYDLNRPAKYADQSRQPVAINPNVLVPALTNQYRVFPELGPEATVPTFTLSWTSIDFLPVANPNDVNDWNVFFNLPTNGQPFTNVSITGNDVVLEGGHDITIAGNLFGGTTDLYSIVDTGCIKIVDTQSFSGAGLTNVTLPEVLSLGTGCFAGNPITAISLPKVNSIGNSCFLNCTSLNNVNFPSLLIVEDNSFFNCISLTSINLPLLQNMGSTVGDDSVFSGISSLTVNLTIPSALMTNNSGSPDGDIQYLQANNTVIITTT